MIRSLLALVALLVFLSIALRIPGLYPAAEGVWHALVAFVRALLSVVDTRAQR